MKVMMNGFNALEADKNTTVNDYHQSRKHLQTTVTRTCATNPNWFL